MPDWEVKDKQTLEKLSVYLMKAKIACLLGSNT